MKGKSRDLGLSPKQLLMVCATQRWSLELRVWSFITVSNFEPHFPLRNWVQTACDYDSDKRIDSIDVRKPVVNLTTKVKVKDARYQRRLDGYLAAEARAYGHTKTLNATTELACLGAFSPTNPQSRGC